MPPNEQSHNLIQEFWMKRSLGLFFVFNIALPFSDVGTDIWTAVSLFTCVYTLLSFLFTMNTFLKLPRKKGLPFMQPDWAFKQTRWQFYMCTKTGQTLSRRFLQYRR